MYEHQLQAVVAALYDLCHKVILSIANTWPAKTIRTNCFKWLGSNGHRNQNVGLVQSGNSPIGEDK